MSDFKEYKPIEEFTYWRFKGVCANSWHQRPTGELFYVDEVDYEKGKVHYYYGDWGYTSTFDEFLNDFTFEPDGERLRDEQIKDLIQKNRDVAHEIEQTKKALELLNPYNQLALAGVDEGSKALVRGVGAIIPIGDPKKAEKLRAGINSAALIMSTKSEEIKERIKLIEALLTEKSQGLDKAIKELNSVIEKMEKVVWTINLYLGRDETLHQLKFGKSAPEEMPITIRQKVLWMAEECAMFAGEGGVTHRSIKYFNEWLLEDPAHLHQVLPEEKGIVVCKPTKIPSKHEDGGVRAQENKANQETYFLMRNGENLYWLTTDLSVGRHLFPKQDEFAEYFETSTLNEATGEYERKVLVPGSAEYNKSMNSADKHVRHYMEIVLFIQGVIHRTHVFEPFPIPKEMVNILERGESENYFRYVMDDEKIITDGHIGFKEWLAEVNKDLAVGHRIMGYFGYFGGYEDRDKRYGDNRLRKHPRGASAPKNCEIFILDELPNEPGQLKFSYTRTDTVYRDRYTADGPARSKGSFRIYPKDDFILAIDRADIENMEYFLNDRVNREHFDRMLPVLQAAIKIKKQEAEDEEPFRKLLTGWFINEGKLSAQDAETTASTLIYWYKFKNKNHRALLADDKKAFRMITNEFKAGQQRERTRDKKEEILASVKDLILKFYPAALYIGHVDGNKYIVLEAEDLENVFLREMLFRYDAKAKETKALKRIEDKHWRVADGRRLKWKELYKSERFENWKFSARAKDFLTFQDTIDLRTQCLENFKRRNINKFNYNHSPEELDKPLFLTEKTSSKEAYLYYYASPGEFNKVDCLTTDNEAKPQVDCREFSWKKQGKRLIVEYTYRSYGNVLSIAGRKTSKDEKFLWEDLENIAECEKRLQEWDEYKKYKKGLVEWQQRYENLYINHMREKKKQERYDKFMREYQNESLWTQWNKQNPASHYNPQTQLVDRTLAFLIERDISPAGMSLAQALEKAKEFGYLPRRCTRLSFGGSDKEYKNLDLDDYDMNFVFGSLEALVKTGEQDEDEDDDD